MRENYTLIPRLKLQPVHSLTDIWRLQHVASRHRSVLVLVDSNKIYFLSDFGSYLKMKNKYTAGNSYDTSFSHGSVVSLRQSSH